MASLTASGDSLSTASNDRVYRTTWVLRGLAVGFLLFLGVELAGDGVSWTWGALTNLALAGSVVLGAVHQLGTSIQVSDEEIRKVMPLWRDRTVRFEGVRRLYVPMVRVDSGVRLYTDPDGSPALTLESQAYERSGDLLQEVARRLPDEATVDDPANRLAGADGVAETGG